MYACVVLFVIPRDVGSKVVQSIVGYSIDTDRAACKCVTLEFR